MQTNFWEIAIESLANNKSCKTALSESTHSTEKTEKAMNLIFSGSNSKVISINYALFIYLNGVCINLEIQQNKSKRRLLLHSSSLFCLTILDMELEHDKAENLTKH